MVIERLDNPKTKKVPSGFSSLYVSMYGMLPSDKQGKAWLERTRGISERTPDIDLFYSAIAKELTSYGEATLEG